MNFSIFVITHVTAGVAALVLFWVAALNKKGTLLHRRIGHAYLVSMALIVMTGIPLTLHAYLVGNHTAALFLGYLLILVSHSCITSVRAIRLRSDRAAFHGPFHLIATGMLGAAGATVMIFGWDTRMAVILVPFGAVGIITLVGLIRDLRKPKHPRNWWLKEHYGAMIGNGIATHIAFSQIGLSRLIPGQGSIATTLGWLLPLVVGLTAIALLDRRYRQPTAKIPVTPLPPASQSQ